MKFKSTARILFAALALSTTCTLTSTVQAKPPVSNSGNSGVSAPVVSTNGGTKFSCVPQGDGSIGTVGQRPGGQPIPLIIWTQDGSSYFGDKYTPQNRCNIVTPKLNAAVAASGGSLKNVVLTNGQVNNESVICVISATERGCNQANVLFTLKPQNAQRAGEILSQIMKIGREGASAGVIRETSSRVQVNLGDWEELTMGADSSQPVIPENPMTPENPVTPDNGGGL